ncbi:MAG: hypothetical protein ACYST5_20935, partial [Planctomycetota bacterium]
ACDLDDDGNVDFADHIILADSWMSACSKFVWCNDAGYNSGGQVDVFDPVTLTEHWLNAERGGTL